MPALTSLKGHVMTGNPDAKADEMPVALKRAGLGLLGLIAGGAVWLIVVRGEAIMVDLAGLAGKVWCF